ncbi:MAG TPA: hypothetical protein VIK18_22655 [Pirellulales bacterium]
MIKTLRIILLVGLAALSAANRATVNLAMGQTATRAATAPGHQTLKIEGWTVFVSDRLREQEAGATDAALALLREQLRGIVQYVPAQPLACLRTVPLWFSPKYPGVHPKAEYHPGGEWLRQHGRNPAMAKGIEFTNIAIFAQEVRRMPVFVLHELAHAYHDQVLGFDQPEIEAAYRHAVDSKSYDAIRRSNGKTERAYAMTNAKEYFAETSEAFFGQNDFFPFNRAELERHDPDMFRLLQRLWCNSPGMNRLPRRQQAGSGSHESGSADK